ncbi:MAG: flavodoxin [Candidatus Accumulibacter sp.]|jgi:flavodoxin I|uniref:flavodoxin n=1 Tax=Accumulibacter sp. TaxID=2053492 RepID=UPI00208A37B7|nr:flavodoxin [Accumulibacter sp.]MBK8116333.1 flavodoxin [Accumulibacter sp.]MBK8578862.1 flavodoxin [Candidatus Accumulibacter propinquus]
MNTIAIYFGTDTGRTRRVAKLIAQKLGMRAQPPLNINRVSVDAFLANQVLILGTPTYGAGQLPGRSVDLAQESWEEFLPRLQGRDLSGRTVALFGLGDQQKYPSEFVAALSLLRAAVLACGARVIGAWSAEGYSCKASPALIDGRFVGLALDPINQASLSEARIDAWLQQVLDELET